MINANKKLLELTKKHNKNNLIAQLDISRNHLNNILARKVGVSISLFNNIAKLSGYSVPSEPKKEIFEALNNVKKGETEALYKYIGISANDIRTLKKENSSPNYITFLSVYETLLNKKYLTWITNEKK